MSDTERPAIPAEIRRRVLVEAGHRCAIPTCRHVDVDVHHIVDWVECKEHKYENLIALCPNCHRRAGKGEIDRKSQRLYKANLRQAYDKFSRIEIDMLFELNSFPPNVGYPWVPFMNIFFKRLLEMNYIQVHTSQSGISMGGVKMSPDILSLTPAGREYIKDFFLDE